MAGSEAGVSARFMQNLLAPIETRASSGVKSLEGRAKKWVRRFSRPQQPVHSDAHKPLAILLQGPVGPFFAHLQKGLEQAGYRVVRINFNAADWVFSSKRGTVTFARDLKEWDGWFSRFVGLVKPDCILMFGCRRRVHQAALAAAAEHDVAAFCFEEGYIRPGFITMEKGGNNDLSPLCNRPELLTTPVDPHLTPAPAARHAFLSMCWLAVAYFTVLSIGRPFFGLHRHHRRRNLMPEAFLWLRNAWRKQVYRSQNFATIESLLEHEDGHYFLAALQVHDDLQLASSSGRGWTNERLITESIASFARSAPADTKLVFKVHPLSRGHTSYRQFARRQAEIFGCADRVKVIDDGSVGLLTRHARGIVTINSTSGLSALFHRKPLLVLGNALFRHPDLACCAESSEDMDAFWRSPKSPDGAKVKNFLDHIRKDALVPGSYYVPSLWKLTCENVIARLESEGVRAQSRRRSFKVVEQFAPAEIEAAEQFVPAVEAFEAAVEMPTAKIIPLRAEAFQARIAQAKIA